MSQPDADSTTNRPSPISPQAFSQLRSSLIRALRSSPDAREPLCDALEALESMQLSVEESRQPGPPHLASRRRPRAQAYAIQQTGEGQFLVEHRPGQSQPFRCPREVYDAAAETLAAADDALHFDELVDRLAARLGKRHPDYRLRVALRFWMSEQAVARFRTRYRAMEPGNFADAAARLWDELAGRPEAGTGGQVQ